MQRAAPKPTVDLSANEAAPSRGGLPPSWRKVPSAPAGRVPTSTCPPATSRPSRPSATSCWTPSLRPQEGDLHRQRPPPTAPWPSTPVSRAHAGRRPPPSSRQAPTRDCTAQAAAAVARHTAPGLPHAAAAASVPAASEDARLARGADARRRRAAASELEEGAVGVAPWVLLVSAPANWLQAGRGADVGRAATGGACCMAAGPSQRTRRDGGCPCRRPDAQQPPGVAARQAGACQ